MDCKVTVQQVPMGNRSPAEFHQEISGFFGSEEAGNRMVSLHSTGGFTVTQSFHAGD